MGGRPGTTRWGAGARRIGAGLLAIVAGCQTESVVTSDGRPMPEKPKQLRRAPVGSEPRMMTLLPGPPEDSNGNGYRDLIPVVTVLFSNARYASLPAEGDFVFALWRRGDVNRPGAEPIRTWRRTGPEVAAALGRSVYGPCYTFRLGLLEDGSDELAATQCDLRGSFEPAAGGAAISASDEVRQVTIGRWSPSGGSASAGDDP